ncbi:MAG: Stk1 family PASTA domain-containing Ser/Thr kinase [Nostocoides sp.]
MTATPRLLGGRYEVGELLGRGGMAEVHKGYDTRLGRDVAIKLLRSDLARDPSFIGRFRREAQSAAGLNHASIVAIYDSGEDHLTETGGASVSVPFIVMEYVEGRTLRERLTDVGHLEPKEAARVTEGVLDALAYSHRAGIVHRDIKPANVMINGDGQIKVMDFGIARAIADSQATMTQTHAVIGTAQYLSPEQAQGLHVDARSDLYSTGCMLFELLTGRAPFLGETPVSIAYQHVGEAAPKPSASVADVPESFDAVVAHALVKDREGRYQTAEDFRADLLKARLGRPVSAAAAGSVATSADEATQVVPTSAAAAAGAVGVGVMAGGMPTEVYAAQSVPPTGTNGNTAGLPPIGHDPDRDPDKRRVGAYVLLTLAVLAVIGGLIFAGVTYLDNNKSAAPPAKVLVPKVIGLQQAVAQQTLTDSHLRMQPNPTASDKPKGEVISQSQDPGAKVDPNTIIDVEVSAGPGSVSIPDVSGLSVDEATQKLTIAPYNFVIAAQKQDKNDSTFDKGMVDSTVPAAGQDTAPNSTITLVVSSGKVTVPDVRGKNSSAAYSALLAAGLTPKVVQKESPETQGTVIDQSPKSGLLDRDATVTITVAIPVTPTQPPTTPSDTATSTGTSTSTGTPTTTGTGTSPPPTP